MSEIVRNGKKYYGKMEGFSMKREEIVNGNMANSMEELIILGKQMENLRDGQQLEEADRISDPQQFDDELEDKR